MAKLFLGGLNPQTTEESIRAYFGRFGPITDAVAMKGPDGRPRCFGFVSFQDPDSASQVIAEGRHDLDGSSVEIKRADGKPDGPRGQGGGGPNYADAGWPPNQYVQPQNQQFQQFQQPQYQQFQEPQYQQPQPSMTPPQQMMPPQQMTGPSGPRQAKLFLGGISKSTTTEGIRAYFSYYGEITDAVAMTMPDGTPRGFGFVTFADAEVANTILQGQHELDGKVLDIKPTTKEGTKGKGGKGGFGKMKSFGQTGYFNPYGKGWGDSSYGKGGQAPMMGKGYGEEMTGQYGGKGGQSADSYVIQTF